jgi:hypothetical protein
MYRLNITNCDICVKRREIQTLHCAKWFTFFKVYSARVSGTHDTLSVVRGFAHPAQYLTSLLGLLK